MKFCKNVENLPKRYLFCFKNIVILTKVQFSGGPGPPKPQNGVKITKMGEIWGFSGNFAKFGEISPLLRKVRFLRKMDPRIIEIPLVSLVFLHACEKGLRFSEIS